MYKLLPMTTALVLALAAAQPVLARDPDKGHGGERRGGGDERGDRGKHAGGDREDRGDRGNRPGDERRAKGEGVEAGRMDRHDDRRVERDARRDMDRTVVQTPDGRRFVHFRRERDRGLIAGCPPGLAKKGNGCLPPGQARAIARAEAADRYNWLWRTREDANDYRYANGYLYRMTPQGALLGYLPVLGGALSPGNAWPGQYQYQPASDYYSRYYGLNNNYDYRYADGALYRVDPKTQMINQVAALLTGQNPNVGQRMPSGYDVYNVPYQYRDQYADSAAAQYRYNDGYVYKADPKTQLITAVIQLLT